MKLIFQPPTGTDLLNFGTSREAVRNEILPESKYATAHGEPENDMYRELGLILGYDTDDFLEFIEVVAPSTCVFAGSELFGPLEDVLLHFRDLGHISDFDDGGYDFREVGIVLFCPAERIETVSIYREGYYD